MCSDAAVKQLILSLDERNRFIIIDLDETHLLISPDQIDWLRAELDVEVSFPFLFRSSVIKTSNENPCHASCHGDNSSRKTPIRSKHSPTVASRLPPHSPHQTLLDFYTISIYPSPLLSKIPPE